MLIITPLWNNEVTFSASSFIKGLMGCGKRAKIWWPIFYTFTKLFFLGGKCHVDKEICEGGFKKGLKTLAVQKWIWLLLKYDERDEAAADVIGLGLLWQHYVTKTAERPMLKLVKRCKSVDTNKELWPILHCFNV